MCMCIHMYVCVYIYISIYIYIYSISCYIIYNMILHNIIYYTNNTTNHKYQRHLSRCELGVCSKRRALYASLGHLVRTPKCSPASYCSHECLLLWRKCFSQARLLQTPDASVDRFGELVLSMGHEDCNSNGESMITSRTCKTLQCNRRCKLP